jgi:hypothetical protein
MSRAAALKYVSELLKRGYTVEKAEAESVLGFVDANGLGYEIRRGMIRVPPFSGEKFRFRALAKEVSAASEEALSRVQSPPASRKSVRSPLVSSRADKRYPAVADRRVRKAAGSLPRKAYGDGGAKRK